MTPATESKSNDAQVVTLVSQPHSVHAVGTMQNVGGFGELRGNRQITI